MLTLNLAKLKSTESEGAYQRAGCDVSGARIRLDGAQRKATDLQNSFWKELRRVSAEMRTHVAGGGELGREHALQSLIEPLKRLKEQLVFAETQKSEAKQILAGAVEKLVKSASLRSAFQGLVSTLKGNLVRRHDARSQEGIAEVAAAAVSSRVKMGAAQSVPGGFGAVVGRRRVLQTGDVYSGCSGLVARDDRGAARQQTSLLQGTAPRGVAVELGTGGTLPVIHAQPECTSTGCVEALSHSRSAHGIDQAFHTVENGDHTLSLSYRLSDGRSVGLMVTTVSGYSVRISIEPRGEVLSSLLLRERSVLFSRLQASGLKIQELSIGPLPTLHQGQQHTVTGQGRRNRRRTLDDDSYVES